MLDNDEVVIDGVRFLGSTLWTDFMLFGDGDERAAAIEEAQRLMRDFSRIRVERRRECVYSRPKIQRRCSSATLAGSTAGSTRRMPDRRW